MAEMADYYVHFLMLSSKTQTDPQKMTANSYLASFQVQDVSCNDFNATTLMNKPEQFVAQQKDGKTYQFKVYGTDIKILNYRVTPVDSGVVKTFYYVKSVGKWSSFTMKKSNNPVPINGDNTGDSIYLLAVKLSKADADSYTLDDETLNNYFGINQAPPVETYQLTQTLGDSTSSLTGDTIQGEKQTVTVTAKSGFIITNATYNFDVFGDPTPFDTINDDSATTVMTPTNDTYIVVDTKPKIKVHNITQQLTYVESDFHGSTIDETEHTITLTSSFSDYEITTAKAVYGGSDIFAGEGEQTTVDFTIAPDGKTATGTFTPTDDVTITGVAEKRKPVTYTLTQHLTHVTSSLSGDTLTAESRNLVLTAEHGYQLTSAVVDIEGHKTPLTPTISHDKQTAALTFTPDGNVTITAVATEPEPVLPTKYSVIKQFTHANSEIEQELAPGKITLTIKADDGYTFTNKPSWQTVNIMTDEGEFSLDNSNTVATATITLPDIKDENPTLTLIAKATVNEVVLSAFSNIYKVDNETLNRLSKERFQTNSSGEIVDYGQYVHNLIKIPFELPKKYISDPYPIQLGELRAKTSAQTITDNIIEVDLGSITVPLVTNDYVDFTGDVKLVAPFTDDIILDIHDVMNKVSHLTYRINLFNRSTTAVVTVDNETISATNFDIGEEIPFIQRQNSSVIGSINSQLENQVFTPYILITRPVVIPDPHGYDTLLKGKLDDYDGYVECNDIIMNTTATSLEQQEIKQLLQQGVYIYHD